MTYTPKAPDDDDVGHSAAAPLPRTALPLHDSPYARVRGIRLITLASPGLSPASRTCRSAPPRSTLRHLRCPPGEDPPGLTLRHCRDVTGASSLTASMNAIPMTARSGRA